MLNEQYRKFRLRLFTALSIVIGIVVWIAIVFEPTQPLPSHYTPSLDNPNPYLNRFIVGCICSGGIWIVYCVSDGSSWHSLKMMIRRNYDNYFEVSSHTDTETS